jgi:hypothetical protein
MPIGQTLIVFGCHLLLLTKVPFQNFCLLQKLGLNKEKKGIPKENPKR